MWLQKGCAYGSEKAGQKIGWHKEVWKFKVQQEVWKEKERQ